MDRQWATDRVEQGDRKKIAGRSGTERWADPASYSDKDIAVSCSYVLQPATMSVNGRPVWSATWEKVGFKQSRVARIF